MASVNTMMTFGLSTEQAKAIVAVKAATMGVDDLVGLGFQAHLASYIANFGSVAPTVNGLMALGMAPALAVDVEALINA